jgi:ribose-phosphate pyrophosphokinase
MSSMKLISGSSNLPFTISLGEKLGLPVGETEITEFPNGEKRVLIKENVKSDNVILVQSFSQPADEHIMETLLLIDALEREGAKHINLVIPWMGYSLQDKSFRAGEPIAAKVVADLISNAYVKRVFLLDLHNSSIPGFFSIPTHHLSAIDVYADYVKTTFGDLKDFVVASPDFGGLKRARVFADKLNLELVNIDKHRDLTTGQVEAVGMSGTASGKNVLIYDDVINGGSTVHTTAELLKENGATSVHFLATHGPLVGSAHEKLAKAPVDSIVVTNSLMQLEKSPNMVVLDVAPLFATELSSWYTAK